MLHLLLHYTIFLPLKSVQRLKLNKESFNDSAIVDCTRASHNRQRAHAMEKYTQLKSMRVIRVYRARHRKEEEVLYFREGDHVFTRRDNSRKPPCAAKGCECSSSCPHAVRSKRTSRLSYHPLSLDIASLCEIQSGFSDIRDRIPFPLSRENSSF